MNFFFEKKTSYFYILSVVILSTVVFIYYLNSKKETASSDIMLHTQEIIGKNNEVLFGTINLETSFRGFLLSGDEQFLLTYTNYKSDIYNKIYKLTRLTIDNAKQQSNIKILKKNLTERIIYDENYIDAKKQDQLNNSEKIAIIEDGKGLTDKIRKSIIGINNEEFRLIALRKIENERNNQFSDLLFVLLIIFIITIFILAFIIIKKEKEKNIQLEIVTVDQKLASQYSLSLIEASLDPLVTINVKGKIMDTNQATVNITGVGREKLIGSDFFEYFTEPQKAREVYQEVFAKGSVADSPLTLRNKNGKLTDVLFNGSVYKDDNKNVLGVVIVARDVTEQKRIATELIEAKVFAELATGIAEEEKINAENATKIAENAVKAKQQFLSNMSHEIRTPMNAIIGFTKVVMKTDLSEKQKEYLSAIKMSGDALIVLINDILDLAKVDAGKMTFEKIPFKLSASIMSMLHVFETKIQEKNLELVTEYDDTIPKILLGDPVRLHQIILNLVSNAIKFTTKGKITVSVQLIDEDDNFSTIEFAISDTGIGIEEVKMNTIFDDFQQATSGTSRLYGGTGLGLAIVKQLVEPQGGTITVKSKINEGSTFSFILKFEKTTIETGVETERVELDSQIKNIKVLVVEDIPLNQLLMKTLLDEFDFERDIAENGKIAIEKLKVNSYDVILMDLQMPIMNGFEATKYIRNVMNLDIPIIALTADVTSVDLAKCKEVGMNDYISKPVDERILYNKIMGMAKKLDSKKSDKIVGQIKSEKCINLDYLNTRTKSNPKLMMEMIGIYLDQTPPIILTMKQSMADKNWPMLSAAVHKIIPSFTIMGINPEFEKIARKILECSKAEQFTEEIKGMVIQVEDICNQACEELEVELNLIKNT